MLPKWHVLLGFVFSYIIYWFSSMTIFQASLIFLASIFIDVDHYFWYGFKKKDWNLKNAFYWNKALPKNHKPIMHIFHTVEFLLLVAILVYFFNPFLFILIGILLHSALDLIEIFYNKKIGCREFWLIRYLIYDKKKYF
ncbi:MAG: hypothetical protein AABW67_02885 [Nanoarchaeota archaeon]|mgnify:CR=1 FL=1